MKPIHSLSGLRESLTSLMCGISTGCGGLRQEYLSLLGLRLEAEGMKRMDEFGMQYLRGTLLVWFYMCWPTVQCVPLYKTGQQDSVRRLGLRNPLLKTFHKEVSKENGEVVREYVERQQIVLSEGGGSKLVFTVRGVMELIQPGSDYEDWAVYKIDVKNSYNETCRAETVRVMESEPTLRHPRSLERPGVLQQTVGDDRRGRNTG
jgi:hypothetical protein